MGKVRSETKALDDRMEITKEIRIIALQALEVKDLKREDRLRVRKQKRLSQKRLNKLRGNDSDADKAARRKRLEEARAKIKRNRAFVN